MAIQAIRSVALLLFGMSLAGLAEAQGGASYDAGRSATLQRERLFYERKLGVKGKSLEELRSSWDSAVQERRSKVPQPPGRLPREWQEQRLPTTTIGTLPGALSTHDQKPLMPAWGSPGENQKCDQAIQALKQLGAGDQLPSRAVMKSSRMKAEVEYDFHCLSREFADRLDNVVGRLLADGEAYCTASLVGPTLIVTALHCVYDLPEKGGSGKAWPRSSLVKGKIAFEVGTKDKIARRSIARVKVYDARNPGRWTDSFDAAAANTFHGGYVQVPEKADFVLLELDRPIEAEIPGVLGSAPFRPNERLVLLGYFSALDDGNDNGMRSNKTGYCQVLEAAEGDRCILHGCATTGGYSGAPIYVLREDGPSGRQALYFAGLNVDSSGTPTGCTSQEWMTFINAGLRVATLSAP